MDELLTVEEVAAILKVHRYTVKQTYIASGKLKAIRVGVRKPQMKDTRQWRIRRSDLEDFISQGQSDEE